MPVINKGVSFSAGEQLTSDKLNAMLDLATFSSTGTTDNTSLNLTADGKLQVKDLGITPAKLSAGGPSWSNGTLISDVIQGDVIQGGDGSTGVGVFTVISNGDILFPNNSSNKIQFDQGNTTSTIYTTPGQIELSADNSNKVNSSNVRFKVDNEIRMQVNSDGVFIREAASAPGLTPSNGIYLYVEGNSLKFRDSTGTDRTVQTA